MKNDFPNLTEGQETENAEVFEVPLKKLDGFRKNVDYEKTPTAATLVFSNREAFASYVKDAPPPEGMFYDLSGKDLSHLDLDNGKLKYTVFNGADLSHLSVVGADMMGSLLETDKTEYANFCDADISYAYIIDGFLHGTSDSSNMKCDCLTSGPNPAWKDKAPRDPMIGCLIRS